MEKKIQIPALSFIRIALLLLSICHVSMAKKQTYIVQMTKSKKLSSLEDHTQLYTSTLASVSTSTKVIYSYKNAFIGFSATLTEDEALDMEARDDVLSILPDKIYELHTTRTPHFLGLDQKAAKLPKFESASKVIIGVVDTGVWPESKSFDDTGFGPIPDNWKGGCDNVSLSKCNRKLVGARYFMKGYEANLIMFGRQFNDSLESRSPLDTEGHGTHTSATAAGSVVHGASFLGYGEGTAHGMAAQARVAMYKVCWIEGCFGTDILAAMDQAIEDNVDVLSLSLGGMASNYYTDVIAVGAFAAMQKGILVSCSAGNLGPTPYSLSNVAPWITTVGAGTLDRDFPAQVILGNGKKYQGVSLYSGTPLPKGKMPQLVYFGNASRHFTSNASLCIENSLNPENVKGKIVLCDRGVNDRVEKGLVVQGAGGLGMVLANTALEGEELVADAHMLPALAITLKTSDKIKKYLLSAGKPTATIKFEGTKLGVQLSPVVAAFSSRGPNRINPEILKPDLIAPGVNILAAWPEKVGPTGLAIDKRRVKFNIISGTSMSCPHVSGLAALVKEAHPGWSPAAIRSALMTTAFSTYSNNNGTTIQDAATGQASNSFGYGAGHVAPLLALHPGLVYDLCPLDYVNFLCALKSNSKQLATLAQGNKNLTCEEKKKYSVNNLNYPSFAVSVQANQKGGTAVVKHKRTLTNVGPPGRYKVSLFSSSQSAKISVFPGLLTFSKKKEKKSYTVTFKLKKKMQNNTQQFGRIEWSDGKHVVGSPIAFSWT